MIGWKARWITPETVTEPEVRKGAGYLRKDFAAESGEAVLYCSAHGLYKVCLNGEPVTEDLFTPGCDQYNKRLQYQTYRVCLKSSNRLEVTLGDGWYRGCSGIDSIRNLYGEDLSFLAQMEQHGEVLLATDASWEASENGPIRMTDMEQGETYDARIEEPSDWHPAREIEGALDVLVPQEAPAVREHERLEGRHIGSGVFDFGQNLAGYTELTVSAEGGETLRIVHGETLDEQGRFTTANFQPGDRNQAGGIRQTVTYTCRPGLNVFKPSFSLFGFRYVQVTGEIPPERVQLTAIAVYSDMRQTASFSCGNEDLNRLFSNCVWSMKSNFCDIPTDCPTRERAGWTGDAGAFAPTGLMLMESGEVFRKWLANARVLQWDDGRMPYIVPQNGPGGQIAEIFSASVGWGDAAVLVPWALYRRSGDRSILAENYAMMRKWVDFLTERAKESRSGQASSPYLIDTGMDYGEWNEPGSNVMQDMQKAFAMGQPEVATAYFSHSASLLSQAAAILGETQDAAHYRELAELARGAYREYWNAHILHRTRRQCEYVRPLAFGLLAPDEAAEAAAALDQLVRENGCHLNTGFLSTPDLCRVLADYGYEETACRLLLEPGCPGWLYAVQKGATTIWETWDGIREDGTVHDSLNHYAYGTIAGWLLEGIAGIRYTFDTLEIRPVVCREIGHVKAVMETPRGRIVSGWSVEGGNTRYTIEIPEGVAARICLKGAEPVTVTGGVHAFEI